MKIVCIIVSWLLYKLNQILALVPDLVHVFAQVAVSPAESDEVKAQIGVAFSHLISAYGQQMQPILAALSPPYVNALAALASKRWRRIESTYTASGVLLRYQLKNLTFCALLPQTLCVAEEITMPLDYISGFTACRNLHSPRDFPIFGHIFFWDISSPIFFLVRWVIYFELICQLSMFVFGIWFFKVFS